MRFEDFEEKVTFRAATLDPGESVNCGVVSGMTRTLGAKLNGANLEHR